MKTPKVAMREDLESGIEYLGIIGDCADYKDWYDWQVIGSDTHKIKSADGEIDITAHISYLPYGGAEVLVVMNQVGQPLRTCGLTGTIKNLEENVNCCIERLLA